MRPSLMDIDEVVINGQTADLKDITKFFRTNLYSTLGSVRGEEALRELSARTALILYTFLVRNAPEA